MKYRINFNKIIIEKCSDFNAIQILESGQIFRYRINNKTYSVFAGKERAIITEKINEYEIECSNVQYFENFFDLKTDYTKIKKVISSNNFIKKAIQFGEGIRILKNEPFEMLVSFIISANNNIKRIKKSIQLICEQFGTNCGDYFAFPTIEQISKVSVEDYIKCGLGYRAEQLYKAIQTIKGGFNYDISLLPTQEAIKHLIELSGVGPKVADCILLFGFYRLDVFPVDTWIEKAYNSMHNEHEKNRNSIRKKLINEFKDYSGYAQQYAFNYKRLCNS